jgi:hypothetical protein
MDQRLVLFFVVVFCGFFATSGFANAAGILGVNETTWNSANVTVINSTTTAVWVDCQAQVTTEFVAKAIWETKHIRVACYRNGSAINEIREALGLPPLNYPVNTIVPFFTVSQMQEVLSVTDQDGRPLLIRLLGGPLIEEPLAKKDGTVVGYNIVYIGYYDMAGNKTIYKIETAIEPFWLSLPVEETVII